MSTRKAFFTPAELDANLAPFISPRTGMLRTAQELIRQAGNPAICVFGAGVSQPQSLDDSIMAVEDGALSGSGASTDREAARVKAYCEAIERYTNYVPANRFIVASRDELGEDALDLELFPRCIPDEYRQPRNGLIPASNQERIRWVQGFSLVSGRQLWVPAVAVYLGIGVEYPGEAFLIPISTGTALAAGYEQALVSGICEVIERDALMVTWLHQLPLPRIDLRGYADPEFHNRMQRLADAGIEQHFFDATTDLGVATIYAVQIAPHGAVNVLVMAATRTNPLSLFNKVIDEAAAARFAIEQEAMGKPSFTPGDPSTFLRLVDGATFYADAANRPAFDFLFESERSIPYAAMANISDPDPQAELRRLARIFAERKLELVAVDLALPTTRAAGFCSVKVIAPQLMPLATNHNARFLATPRLYQAAPQMGYPARTAETVNPWPQPFA